MSGTTELQVPETLNLDPVQPPPADAPAVTPEPAERPLSAREEMLAAIVARHDEQREAEMAQGVIQHDEAVARGEAEPAEAEPVAQEPAPVVAPPVAAPQPAPALHAIQMPDGQMLHVTQEQMAHLAHMGVLANLALAQPPTPPPAPAAVAEPPRQRMVLDDAVFADTVQKIQYGDPESAAAALRGLVNTVVANVQPTGPAIDPNAIIAAATHQALQKQQLREDAARIQSEFPDIFANEQLKTLAHMNVEAIRQRDRSLGQARPEIEVYREAGGRVYDAIGKSRPGIDTQTATQAAPAVAPRADVLERKRAAPRIPAAVDRRAAAPETPRAPTNSEIVNRMRQQRGQPSMH